MCIFLDVNTGINHVIKQQILCQRYTRALEDENVSTKCIQTLLERFEVELLRLKCRANLYGKSLDFPIVYFRIVDDLIRV